MGPDPHPITPVSHPLSHPHKLPANKQLLQLLLIPSVLSSTTLHFLFHLLSLQPRAKPKSLAVQSTNIPTRSALLRRHRNNPPTAPSHPLSLPTRPPNDAPSPHVLDRTQFNASHHDWVDITTCGPQSRSIGLPTARTTLFVFCSSQTLSNPRWPPAFGRRSVLAC